MFCIHNWPELKNNFFYNKVTYYIDYIADNNKSLSLGRKNVISCGFGFRNVILRSM